MIGVDYGDEVPWSDIIIGETVYVVDFSFPIIDMVEIDHRVNLIVIDHHKTFIDACDHHGLRFPGIMKEGIGACAWTWSYLYPSEPMPYAVLLLAEYDVWDHHNPDTLPFQYGMRLHETAPESLLWSRLLPNSGDDVISSILERGETVLTYSTQSNTITAQAAFETELCGIKCIAVNKLFGNSSTFDSVWDEDKYDAMLVFGWFNGVWKVSIYSTKVDVSDIAVTYGGGGHPCACGFTCDELPFKLR